MCQGEKQRHLAENSSEREQWRSQYKQVEQENLGLKTQLQELSERYERMEEAIADIRKRESAIRERCEKEIDGERDRNKQASEEMELAKERYTTLKLKIQQQN